MTVSERPTPLAAFALCVALLLTGCEDLKHFSTRPNESYCGTITLGSPFRVGLSPRVQMRLELDAEKLDDPEGPGRIWTFEAASADRPERRLLNDATLRPIPAVMHDPISHFEMGEARLRNAVYVVSPSDTEAEGLVAFLSLRSDDDVEVRLLRPGSAKADAGDGQRQIFGMFSLEKREDKCGF